MDVFGQIWPNEYPAGKVHQSVVRYIGAQITAKTRLERIYRLVVMWGVRDDLEDTDALATYRALRDLRNAMGTYVRKPRIS